MYQKGLPRLVCEQLASFECLGALLLQPQLAPVHQAELQERVFQTILHKMSCREKTRDRGIP